MVAASIWLLSLIVFTVGVVILFREEDFLGLLFSGLGLIFLIIVTFLAVPRDLPSGLPDTYLDIGEYKVAFVYVAGENVNVGIEKEYSKSKMERLFLYQFKRSAFDSGSFNFAAKKLEVVESGGFKKLVLK
jgi:hypothetical protein